MRLITKLLLIIVCCLFADTEISAQRWRRNNLMRQTSRDFFRTDDAKRIGDQILVYQRETGGWPKNIDMARKMSESELDEVRKEKGRTDDSTIDNGATTMQMQYLSSLHTQLILTLLLQVLLLMQLQAKSLWQAQKQAIRLL